MALTLTRTTADRGIIDPSGIVGSFRRAGFAAALPLMLGLVGAAQFAMAQETGDEEIAAESPAADDTVPPPVYRVVVDNRTEYPIAVLAYDDEDGSISPYDELPAGGALDEQVVSGLLWLFEVNGQALLGQYVTTDQPEQYVVLDEAALSAIGYPPGPMDDGWRTVEDSETDAPAPDAAPVPGS